MNFRVSINMCTTLVFLILCILNFPAFSEKNTSAIWLDFTKAKTDGAALPFPDFSGAGYHNGLELPPDIYTLGLPVFDISDYGADGSDDKSDFSAISAAISAAKRVGGGIIFFPPGRYDIRSWEEYQANPQGYKTRNKPMTIFDIASDNIFLKGSGNHEHGTTLYMEYPIESESSSDPWSAHYMFWFRNSKWNADSHNEVGNIPVTADSLLGSREIFIKNTSGLVPGDFIHLVASDTRESAIINELYPFQNTIYNKKFTELYRSKGISTRTYYQIESISDNRLVLKSGLLRNLEVDSGAYVQKAHRAVNYGVEDLIFEGNFDQEFIHHGGLRSGTNAARQYYITEYPELGGLSGDNIDYGWSAFHFTRVAHSWVRRVTLHNVVRSINMAQSTNLTIYQVNLTGSRGHLGISASDGGSWNLVMDCHDLTVAPVSGNKGMWHTFGQSAYAAGNVFLKISWPEDTTFDSHPGGNYATLYDSTTGALGYNHHGGQVKKYPQMGKGLTFWNFHSLRVFDGARSVDTYEFWRTTTAKHKVVPPVMVGYSGAPVTFPVDQVVFDESHGTPVFPESLYIAQMEFNYGKIPDYLSAILTDNTKVLPIGKTTVEELCPTGKRA